MKVVSDRHSPIWRASCRDRRPETRHERSVGGLVRAADPARWEAVHLRGPQYLRAILQRPPSTSCCARRRKSAHDVGLLRSFHACAMGVNVGYTCRQRRTSWSSPSPAPARCLPTIRFLARMMSETDTGPEENRHAYLYLRACSRPSG